MLRRCQASLRRYSLLTQRETNAALRLLLQVPGDGRELVATDATAVKIRAEDGRRVAGVDISPFINGLPAGRSTTDFTTDDASGSTSQAANIQVLSAGPQTLMCPLAVACKAAAPARWRQGIVTGGYSCAGGLLPT